MSTKKPTRRRARGVVLSSLGSLGLLLAASAAHATSGYLSTWSSLYPGSASDNNAGCQLCHGTSTQNLNPTASTCAPVAAAAGTITQRIQAAEGVNSDGDAGGYTNLEEINASTQPGWTTGAIPVWNRTSCASAGTNTAPTSIGALDPTPAAEICDNGIDDNGNGLIDCADPRVRRLRGRRDRLRRG